ncbi:deubiquitinase OTUD6B [Patella vulgata]|uniref:deubiquitinase OTUD6B n=1 Tax=Patella vulgata TaxID=6465 RepID=UPI0021801380|nr:deubiquitinase OTUD6B [Patella vulgata]
MSDENASDSSGEEESLHEKHRNEKKDMLAEIQKIRHSVPKNDKKKKKDAQEQIAKLENELKDRHQTELAESKGSGTVQELTGKMGNLDVGNSGETKESAEVAKRRKQMAKNQKRRDKKSEKNKERDAMLKQQELDNLSGKRHLETQKIKQLLAARNLKIREIASDGNCLYNAVSHQMKNEKVTNESLRRQTSEHMKGNVDEFLPFLTKLDTGDCYTPEEYEYYCDAIANTSTWGGHLEIQAISKILKCRIEIIQAEGAPIILGEEYNNSNGPIVLAYHRHAFGLGEHYNSVEPKSEIDAENL